MTREEADTVIRFVAKHYPRLRANLGSEYIGRGWSVIIHNPTVPTRGILEVFNHQIDEGLREDLDRF